MKQYTLTIKRTTLCTVYVEAEDEMKARDKFFQGDFEEGQEIDILHDDLCDVREDKE